MHVSKEQYLSPDNFIPEAALILHENDFKVEIKYNDRELVLMVIGEIDEESGISVENCARKCVDKYPLRDARVDLSQVTFINSAGLRSIWNIRDLFLSNGRIIKTSNASPAVSRIIDLLNAEPNFDA